MSKNPRTNALILFCNTIKRIIRIHTPSKETYPYMQRILLFILYKNIKKARLKKINKSVYIVINKLHTHHTHLRNLLHILFSISKNLNQIKWHQYYSLHQLYTTPTQRTKFIYMKCPRT